MQINKNIIKKLNKILAIAFACSLLMISVSGCSKNETVSESDGKAKSAEIEIGMCFDSFIIERWLRDRDVFVSCAKDLGATVNVQNANGSVEEQRKQIQYFIDKGVDAIAIVPVDCGALDDLVADAKDKGIRIISYDRLILNADADLYISFDNSLVGQLMGEAVASQLEVKSVIMVNGPTSDNNVSMVESAFKRKMVKSGIEVVDVYYVDNWNASLAGDYISNNLPLVEEAEAIMCGNDDVASNVIRVLAINQMAGNKYVVGQDADLLACQHIVEGTQLMTVYKPVEKLASEAAKATVSLIKGEEINADQSVNDGKYDIPYIAIEPISVNSSNMDSVIVDSGFHSREDVYLNVKK